MSVNKVILVGRLTRDVDLRSLKNGDSVANASLATSEKWTDKSGEKQEKAEFHNLIFFRGLADLAAKYLVKGSQIYVEGKLATRKYEKDGVERYTTEIIVNDMKFISSGKKKEEGDEPAAAAPPKASPPPKPTQHFDDFDDDIPF
jgi:single-strand DNA-binding protein